MALSLVITAKRLCSPEDWRKWSALELLWERTARRSSVWRVWAIWWRHATVRTAAIVLSAKDLDVVIGCGSGREVAWLNATGFPAVGFDASEGLLKEACQRYSGVSIQGVTIGESPVWLQDRLKSIGLRPINNIVDITNFILHETGQPLHAFDADMITGKKLVIKNLPEGTVFVTLDEKERKLSAEDLLICNEEEPMCIGGVYGGLHSGVTVSTKNIFDS